MFYCRTYLNALRGLLLLNFTANIAYPATSANYEKPFVRWRHKCRFIN